MISMALTYIGPGTSIQLTWREALRRELDLLSAGYRDQD
jgi:hypothetical protein